MTDVRYMLKESSHEPNAGSDQRRRAFLKDEFGFRPATIVGVGILVGLGTLAGIFLWTATGGSVASSAQGATGPSYLNLTIVIDPTTGAPKYTPANFTVPRGEVIVTIVDTDSGDNWSACQCNVSGTVGNTETVNGTTVSSVPSSDVAHTFTVPALGINVLSPGGTTVTFTVDFATAGSYTWMCLVPCGQGADGYTTPPMGDVGFMTGTLTVA